MVSIISFIYSLSSFSAKYLGTILGATTGIETTFNLMVSRFDFFQVLLLGSSICRYFRFVLFSLSGTLEQPIPLRLLFSDSFVRMVRIQISYTFPSVY